MLVKTLNINNLRNIEAAGVTPHSQLNLFLGDNGAGKTSVLEALVVLAKGRSFRTGQADALVGPEGERFRVVARTWHEGGAEHRLGLERGASGWTARRDGEAVTQLGELAGLLPLVLMEPNSHLLVSGPPDERRRYLDWGVFHVKHVYLDTWRRFGRALRQRNAALKAGRRAVIEALDVQAAELGEVIHAERTRQVALLIEALREVLGRLGPELAAVTLDYRGGWRGDTLAEALQRALERDLERGATSAGPHRADLEIRVGGRPARDVLSRGEQKLLAAGLLMSQARTMAESGVQPVLLLDDLASEFDRRHLKNMVAAALEAGYQTWITGTGFEPYAFLAPGTHAVFHVERGRIEDEPGR